MGPCGEGISGRSVGPPDGCVGRGHLHGFHLHNCGLPAERPSGIIFALAALAAQEVEGGLGDLLDAFSHV